MRFRLFLPALVLPVLLQFGLIRAESAEAARFALRDLNTLRDFPKIESRTEWQARAKEIREQVLVSCGLWPLPEKTPLRAHVFDKKERDGYSVEKVYIQTHPGFYLAGNLYRPLGKGNGPFPAILNPHGHWDNGRMADNTNGSIAARCISFARQGMIAFSYDMVGYNDTRFASESKTNADGSVASSYKTHRSFATNAASQLWNISLMGLQTWNSIRALDFLESLPDVDKKRLACTGESGGGTQTFMLGAVDKRLAVQAPIVMVSHSMQGGCLCENAPGLRVDYSNMEIAAAPAPRPQILVAASGDWTKDTMEVEGPSIESVYRLFGATDKLRYVRFNFGHNYNQTSREAVYEWFARFLLHSPNRDLLKEAAYKKEPDADLRVFPDDKFPADAVTEAALIEYLIQSSRNQLAAWQPKDKKSLADFKEEMLPAWKHTFQVALREQGMNARIGANQSGEQYPRTELKVRDARGNEIPIVHFQSGNGGRGTIAVLAHPRGKSAYLDDQKRPAGLARELLSHNVSVLLFDAFQTGEVENRELAAQRKPFDNFFTTYNRTDLQERVQDLITACAFAKGTGKGPRVVLCGAERAGLWAMAAAPAADAVVADCDQFDSTSNEAFLEKDVFVPGIRKIGGFEGSLMLAAPNPAMLHNTGEKFGGDRLRQVYAAVGAPRLIRAEKEKLDDKAVAEWIAGK